MTRARTVLVLLALCLVPLALGLARPAAAATLRCCLDDWQGGGVCPAGQKLFAYCGAGCENCGTFTCVPSSTPCLR
jgi:hypothetical protein